MLDCVQYYVQDASTLCWKWTNKTVHIPLKLSFPQSNFIIQIFSTWINIRARVSLNHMQYIGYFLVDLSLSPYLLYRLDELWWAAKISNNPFSGLPLSESAYNYLIRPSSSAQTTLRTMGDLHEARMILVNLLFLRGTSDITQSRPGLSIRGSRDRRRGAH
jgi:hypothetical protein